MEFAIKTVWITGASSGIGEALAYALADRGAHLVLSARRAEKLEAVREACTYPERHIVLPLDLSETDTLPEKAAEAERRAGPVDVLVNNGGISQRSLAVDTSIEVDRRLMEVNYFGTVALTKAVLPSMLRRGAGRIAVVTSLVGHISTPMRSAYAASKHALHGFFEALRAEVYEVGVRITMVCPGYVRTQVSVNALTADGTPQGLMDRAQEDGMAPEACAAAIADVLETGRDEVLIGGAERFGVYLNRLSPALFRAAVRNMSLT